MYKTAVGRCGTGPQIPETMASTAVKSLCNKGRPLSEEDQMRLKEALEEGFKKVLTNPDPQPTTYNGLGTHDAAWIAMDQNGKPRPVSEKTKIGRMFNTEFLRHSLYSKYGPTLSYQAAGEFGGWMTDQYHARGPHATEDGNGLREHDLMDECERRIEAGEGVPRNFRNPYSIKSEQELH
jgi:hypothetical protein